MFDNVIRIRFAIQKRSPKNFNKTHPERTPVSFCKCSKYKKFCGIEPIQRGETIVIIKRRVVMFTNSETGIKTGYYKDERWRVECLSKVMLIMGEVYGMKNILQPLKKDMKRDSIGAPPRLKEVWRLTDEEVKLRASLQRRASTYRVRLRTYQENPHPTDRTLKAIENCKIKIQIAETALESQLRGEPLMKPGFQEE